ncbi:MAG: DUF465 domain-containing protein [Alphaproteobacteria bacterium]
MDDSEREKLQAMLIHLETEHRDLDDVIRRLLDGNVVDQLQIQRLKKRKLILKDQITQLHNLLLPDIIA